MKKVPEIELYKTIEEVFKEYCIAQEKEKMIPHLRSLRENWSIVSEQIVHFAINEISTLLNSARHESEHQKLPEELVEKSTDELYLIWQLINSWWELIKGSCWEREPDDFVFIAPDIDSFYNALVDLYYQGRIAGRCADIMMKRGDEAFKKYPISRSLLAVMESQGWEEEGYITESHCIAEEGEKEVRKYVEAVARQRNIPSWDREEKVQDVIGNLSNKMRQTPYHKRLERYFCTPENISDAFTDAYRYQKADKRTPPGGEELSRDELIEIDDGEETPRINNIPAPQIEMLEELIDAQRKKLKDLLGKTAARVCEFIYNYRRECGKIPKPGEIREALGYAPAVVSRARKKICENGEEIQKILGI
jgi:hypothetical protein